MSEKDSVPAISASTEEKTGADVSERRNWRGIDSAPRDGTPVDLWMTDQDGRGWRVCDAYYVHDYDWPVFELRHERYVRWEQTGTVKRDGWWAPHQDYDDADGWCDHPRWFNSHPRQMREEFTLPTHWMPLPAPPIDGGEDE